MDDTLDYDELIRLELEEWKKIGIPDPASVMKSNSFIDSAKVMAITNLLKEKGLITEDELQLSFKKEMLDHLQEARKGISTARRNQITKGILN